MISSSVGSGVFLGLTFTTICLITLLVLQYYLPIRTTPAYLLVPVFLALVLPASIVLLVPIDLASASATGESDSSRGIWLPDRALLVLWRIAYWLTFALTWLVLPLLGDFSDSGFRSVNDRVRYALRVNAQYQLTVLGCGTAGLLYVFLQRGIYPTSLKSLIMALAYAWGLTLAIYLMGHGLVTIPKRLWRDANLSRRLRHIHSQAPRLKDRMDAAQDALEELERTIQQLQQKRAGTTGDMKEWIEELADGSGLPESQFARSLAAQTAPRITIPAVVTDRYLADLTRKIKRARHKNARFLDEWQRLKLNAVYTEAVIDAASSRQLVLPSGPVFWIDRFANPAVRYHFHATILPLCRYGLSILLAAASFSIIWSEVIKSFFPSLSLVGLSIIHHPSSDRGQIGFAGQLMAACWLLYMCTAALLSISEVKVWGNRALVRRNTYAESACWYACQVAKLTVPLSYNFSSFVPKAIFENTTFYQFLGRLIDLTPLGLGFDRIFPIFIVVSVLANLLNLYGRVKTLAGFGATDDDDETNPDGYATGNWREGRALLARDSETPGDALGLASRTHSPLPGSMPYSDRLAEATRRPGSAGAARVLGGNRARQEAQDDADVQGNYFSDLAHRVKNTVESAVSSVPTQGIAIARPKWMASSDSATPAVAGGVLGGIGEWFTGKSNGGVRL